MMLAGVWEFMEQAKGTVWSFQRGVAETEAGLESLEEPSRGRRTSVVAPMDDPGPSRPNPAPLRLTRAEKIDRKG